MTELFYTDTSAIINCEKDRVLPYLSSKRAATVARLRNKDDIVRSVCAEALLFYIVKNKKLNTDMVFYYNDYGKPYFSQKTHCFFNISHSGSKVVCICSNCEVGIDVEKIGSFDLRIARYFYDSSEYRDLLNIGEEVVRRKRFYEYWVMKESYLKYTGYGLHYPPQRVLFKSDESGKYCCIDSEVLVSLVDIDTNYACAVCQHIKSSDLAVCTNLVADMLVEGLFDRKQFGGIKITNGGDF